MGTTASGRGAGQGRFRQAQAWLHTWCGLWFSWLLFAIFLTGTLAVFEEPISHWMTPEHHAEEAAALHAAPSDSGGTMAQRLAWGLAYMDKHHPGAEMWELWPADAQGAGNLTVYWFDAARAYAQARLDPATGEVMTARPKTGRDTLGGHHFVDFHYRLHAGNVGLWLVGIAALAMLVALVSGVIIHRRIFQDFFTFRPRKGQRSWLDAHNVSAVVALPYHLMITYTGLLTLVLMYMPWAPQTAYRNHGGPTAFLAEALGETEPIAASGQPTPLADLAAPVALAQRRWPGALVEHITVDHPGDAQARITVTREVGAEMRLMPPSMRFSGVNGAPEAVAGEEPSTPVLTYDVATGLHTGRFAGPLVRALVFLSGLAGCALVATGLLLWAVKERPAHLKARQRGERGSAALRLVDGLNLAGVAGLLVAMAAFFWINRLLPVATTQRAQTEIDLFFAVWGGCALLGLARPTRGMWRAQVLAAGTLLALVPLLNAATGGAHWGVSLSARLWAVAGLDAVCLLLGLALLAAARWLKPLRPAVPAKPLTVGRPIAPGLAP